MWNLVLGLLWKKLSININIVYNRAKISGTLREDKVGFILTAY